MALGSNITININLASIQEFFADIFSRISHLSGGGVALLILAITMPPIAVLLKVGFTTQFWINIFLTILGYVPGQLHAVWVILF